MEFITSSGGDTKLVFDDMERLAIDDLARRRKTTIQELMDLLAKLKQGNPLDTFEQLLGKLPSPTAGLVKGKASPPSSRAATLVRQVEALHQVLHDRMKTSGSIQVEAVLLQALSVNLQTQVLLSLGAELCSQLEDIGITLAEGSTPLEP